MVQTKRLYTGVSANIYFIDRVELAGFPVKAVVGACGGKLRKHHGNGKALNVCSRAAYYT